ncbi:MAG: hypothetical protein K0R67_3524 [Paenibacillus sp.]|nr:hypothetical protein [Paenibacillus sp.]
MRTMLNGMRRSRRLLLLVALQTLFLLGLSGSYYAAGWWGEEIRLQTEPVDPRDLLYGDYVILNYEISSLKPELWKESGEKPDSGEVIYVVLKPDNEGIYRAIGAYADKPAVSGDEKIIKGKVSYSWDEAITVKYGLERYYVPEGTGGELEDKTKDTIVQVKIAPWGQMRITGLEL